MRVCGFDTGRNGVLEAIDLLSSYYKNRDTTGDKSLF
nr:MAG TPA: hypothetical protein [Caudoviricetes sp.]